MVKNDWIIDNNSFRYFNANGELIVHLFRSKGVWQGYVLGSSKEIKTVNLDEALITISKLLKECGWENE